MSAGQPAGVAGLPSGAAVRRWTKRVVRARRTAGAVRDLFSDVYTVVLNVAVALTMVVTALRQIGGQGISGPAVADAMGPWLATGMIGLAFLGLASLLLRIGPVAVPPHQAQWWLSLPVDRTSLLWPMARSRALISAIAMAGVSALAGLAAFPQIGWQLLAMTIGGGLLGAVVALALVGVQAAGGGTRAMRIVDAVLGAATLTLAVVLLWLPEATPPTAVLGVTLLAMGAVLLAPARWRAHRLLPRLHDSDMSERGAVADHLRGATSSLDTRELGRALTAPMRQRSRPASGLIARAGRGPGDGGPRGRAPGGGGTRGGGPRGGDVVASSPPRRVRLAAMRALLIADLLLLRRSPRRLVQLACAAAVPVIALAGVGAGAAAVALCCVTGAWVGALGLAEGARRGYLAPAIEESLPLGQRAVRAMRVLTVTIGMLAWSLVVGGALAWTQDEAAWLVLIVLTAPTWAAGAVRSAYRPDPDWSAPLIHTPMGSFPPGLTTVVSVGIDVVVLGAIPVTVALLAGVVNPVLLLAQLLLTVVVVGIAVRPGEVT